MDQTEAADAALPANPSPEEQKSEG